LAENQTSFLTALVKNLRKVKTRKPVRKRIENEKNEEKLTTSKWQPSVHKFLKCPQKSTPKQIQKNKQTKNLQQKKEPNEMQSKRYSRRIALSPVLSGPGVQCYLVTGCSNPSRNSPEYLA